MVVSTGSNHSIAVALAGALHGARVVNMESSVRFVKPSRAYRLLRSVAWLNVVQWPEQCGFGGRPVLAGPFYEEPRYRSRDEGYVLVTTGTYGYRELFDELLTVPVRIVLQTGRVDPTPYRAKRPDWTVFDFDPDIDRWIAGATLVVTHLGKTALDAALAYRKPVIIVHNPRWSRHGAGPLDAQAFARRIGARLATPRQVRRMLENEDIPSWEPPPPPADGAKLLAEILTGRRDPEEHRCRER